MRIAPLLCLPGIVYWGSLAIAQPLQPEFSGGLTVIGQRANEARIDSLVTASADLFVTVPRAGGSWLIYLEGNSTPADDGVASRLIESNADAGSALDRDRRGRVQVSEFNYTLQLEQGSVTAGLIDPSGYLDRSRITNDENVQFMGAGFVNNPTIEFPDYSLGFAWQRASGDGWPEVNLVIASSHGLADNPNLSYPQLLSVTDDDKGLFAGIGLAYRSEANLFRFGGWLNTAAHTDFSMTRDDQRNYGLYGVYGHTSGSHGFNLRAGLANDEVSQASAFASLAYRYRLGNGALGIGLSRSFLSGKVRDDDRDDTTQVEVFFRFALGEHLHLTPSVQYLVNSGFDRSGQLYDPRITVVGLRLHYSL